VRATQKLEVTQIEIANRPNTKSVFGLVAFRAFVKTELPLQEADLKISFGKETARLDGKAVFSRHSDSRWRVMFHANTHLVNDGDHELSAEIILSSGEAARFAPLKLQVSNAGLLAAAVAKDLRDHGSPVLLGQVIDSAMFPYTGGQARAWFDQESHTPVPLSTDPAPDAATAHAHLNQWGFCVLHEQLPRGLAEQFLRETDEAIDSGQLPYTRGTSQRILNAHRLPAGREIWLYPPVLQFLSEHFRDDPCACQTLTYINGSEQDPHQDTIHLTPYPAGYMCGVWVALQDVVPDSGELVVYPGSHRTPRLYAGELGLEKVSDDYSSYVVFDARIKQLLAEGGYERLVYRPKAGQILVWHENLIHGGSVRINRDLTRKSVVSHYFPRGAVGYYDSRGEAASLESIM
jgi:hypothetical protein